MKKKELQHLQDMVLLWTVTWAAIGLVFGIAQLLRTGQVSWIPSLGLGAAAAGLGMGVVARAKGAAIRRSCAVQIAV